MTIKTPERRQSTSLEFFRCFIVKGTNSYKLNNMVVSSPFCYHYQYIAISNLRIISQKRYKNTYMPKKYEKPAVRSNYLQYVATVTTLCYYLKNKKTLGVTENYLYYRHFWTKFWTLLAAFTWQLCLIKLVELLPLYKLIITTEFLFPVR